MMTIYPQRLLYNGGYSIGYDIDPVEHFLSDNPNFKGFERDGYIEDYEYPITYQFNQYGHRSPVNNQREHFLVVGGSQSFGFGVPEDKTYAHMISQELGLDHYNLALPGISHDGNIFNLFWYISNFKPKFIIWEWLFNERMTFFQKERESSININANNVEALSKNVESLRDLPSFYVQAESCGYAQSRRNMHEMMLTNISRSIDIYQFDMHMTWGDINKKYLDYSRDGEHFGVDTHKWFGEHIIEWFELEKYSTNR